MWACFHFNLLPSVLAESWIPTHTRVSFATEGDSLGEQERAWEMQGAGQEESQEQRRGPETVGEISGFLATHSAYPRPQLVGWDSGLGAGSMGERETARRFRKAQNGKYGLK